MQGAEISRSADSLSADGLRLACVVSRFNSRITERLLRGALEAVHKHGGDSSGVLVVRVPGALELATAARALAVSGRYDALVCLGAVIRGETDHYRWVAEGAVHSIGRIGPETGVPATFGVLTCETPAQAEARSQAGESNAGYHAAVAAMEMARLLEGIRSR